ncbi:MAG: helix-turn-helix transcriptional regulator [Clostridia bacterium]|nr:helix-turn-helix transcriptional regulator [Clostridia bacterium]
MISYRPFWETLNKRNISTYELIYRQGISANTIYRMKHDAPITTKTLNELCFILNCAVSDIIEYQKECE